MRLEDDIYEHIKQVIIDIFIEYDIKGTPINAFEIAIKMGLKVIPYSALNEQQYRLAMKQSEDGFSLEVGNNGWNIYYNDNCKSYGRISQTIMHEIGHYALGHIDDGAEEEAEAKFFAKYALAPPPLVHQLPEVVNVDKIMETFDLSWEAACIAYNYYKTWLRHGDEYVGYELDLLSQFNIA